MKYMGSKRAMLQNGLGELLRREHVFSERFFDLFSGSGAVAIHVARQFPIQVFASDLQAYSAVIAGSIIERQRPFNGDDVWNLWKRRAKTRFDKVRPPAATSLTQPTVYEFRRWCNDCDGLVITKAYGGYYFSPVQAVWIDSLLSSLPKGRNATRVALAALIRAASRSAAAPGHTAQPFQPTRTAKPFLQDAWSRDILGQTEAAFKTTSMAFAQKAGRANVADANEAADTLRKGDIAFLDPPYSGVHYSRFYHVLETIARNVPVEVSGEGRYPAPEQRPRSKYSVQTESVEALDNLLGTISSRGARAILTFPARKCSNGLSGAVVLKTAGKYFNVNPDEVWSKLSTLGGTGEGKGEAGRAARKKTKELMLVLHPK